MGVMLIDGNAIGRAAAYASPLIVDGREVQAIYQTLRSIKSYRREFPNMSPIVLWDGRAQWRFDLYPEYKSTRDDDIKKVAATETYHDQKRDIIDMLALLGIPQVTAPHFEADDLAGYFVRHRKGKEVLLITGDEDWIQLVSPEVSWHDPRSNRDKWVDYERFLDQTGYSSPTNFLRGKALQGDSSDAISGWDGIGKKAALALAESFDSIAMLKDYHNECGGEFRKGQLPDGLSRFRSKLNAICDDWEVSKAIFRRNVTLMNLRTAKRDKIMKADMKVHREQKDIEAFGVRCAELAFISITRDLKAWNNAF